MKSQLAGASRDEVLCRAYGVPTKLANTVFPNLDERVVEKHDDLAVVKNARRFGLSSSIIDFSAKINPFPSDSIDGLRSRPVCDRGSDGHPKALALCPRKERPKIPKEEEPRESVEVISCQLPLNEWQLLHRPQTLTLGFALNCFRSSKSSD